MSEIPLCVPSINGNEWKYVKECLDTEWVSSAGKYVDLFEAKIAEYTGSKYAVACVNGTSALQVSLRLIGLNVQDEVIVPSLTFIAPINSIKYLGASPVFMDSDKYYNLDIDKTIEFLNKETIYKDGFTYNKSTGNKIAAIIPVHIWGNACLLDNLYKVCRDKNISIVEDASESLGTFYKLGKFAGKHTGTIGQLGCISFNGNKIITTGGGGVILTNNQDFARRAKYLTTQAKDDPVKYIHNEIGYNFRLTNIQAALGVAQLEQLSSFLKNKKRIFLNYQKDISRIDGLSIANVPDYSVNNHWINVLNIDNQKYKYDRDSIMAKLEENGIQARPVWKLNHLQRPYNKCQSYHIDNSYELVDRSLCLPSSVKLTSRNIKTVVDILK